MILQSLDSFFISIFANQHFFIGKKKCNFELIGRILSSAENHHSVLLYLDAPDVTTTNNLMESYEKNSTLILSCSFVGLPPPLLEWTHKSRPLGNNSNLITITNTRILSNGTSMLQWINLPIDADGIFACVATNNVGSQKILIDVQILSTFLVSKTVLIYSVLYVCMDMVQALLCEVSDVCDNYAINMR